MRGDAPEDATRQYKKGTILSPPWDGPGMGLEGSERSRRYVQIESTSEEPPMAKSNPGEKTTYEHNETRKLLGTLPLDDLKNLTVVIISEKNMRGREVASEDALAAAGPPRVVPRSSEHDAEGSLSGGCSVRTATGEGAIKEPLVKAS